MKTLFLAVFALTAFAVEAFEVKQVFREERFTRGNTGYRCVQPFDAASWIWLKGVEIRHASAYPIVRFRTTFESSGETLRFDVSADPRYVLLLDGQEISRGPHKGFVERWYYQTYEVSGLAAGRHRLEAVVFHLGDKGPLAILSSGEGGFALKAEGVYDARLTTGKAAWEAASVNCTSFGSRTDPHTMTGGENIVRGTGFLAEADLAWQPATVTVPPLKDGEYGCRTLGRKLFPTERFDDAVVRRTPGAVRAAAPVFGRKDVVYTEADAKSPWTAKFDALLKRGEKVTVPPQTEVRFIWDFDDYCCGYPQLGTSGGKGATIRWAWTECLYGTNLVGRIYVNKGRRGDFVGKRVVQAMHDTFLPDGRPDAAFTVPWWKCGRWVEISVKTADEPLALTDLAIVETRYPMEATATFDCDDPTIADIRRICVRGMQNCMHEMFMDCPYFEQQMYPGDTRVEMLILNSIFGDDRMLRFGIGIFDAARRSDGTVPMNFPTYNCQDSSTYSMCWAMMCGDYALWHGANEFLRARLPGLRHTLSAIDHWKNADGLLENLPGWSFEDWVPEWDSYGNAPDGRLGVSSVNNLLFVYALRSAERVERAFGEEELAACWRRKAEDYAAAIRAKFWDEGRGLLADTAAHDRYSEHAQCLALLSGVLNEARSARAFKGLLEAKDLARTTVYFSHYLFDTYFKFGRADLFLRRLDLWRDFVRADMRTPLEAPGARGRSDCHAWGAHPLYHLQTGVAGIRPAANGFSAVEVAPQPGGLRFVKASMPTPKGPVAVDLRFEGDKASGTVTLPKDLPGTFRWRGASRPLAAGVNEI